MTNTKEEPEKPKRPESRELLPCSECAILNHMQPCEACDNDPKKKKARTCTFG